jgi:hypothetical protein
MSTDELLSYVEEHASSVPDLADAHKVHTGDREDVYVRFILARLKLRYEDEAVTSEINRWLEVEMQRGS